jgi:hypothetical protein
MTGRQLQRADLPFTELKPAHSYGRTPPRLFNLHSADAGLLRGFEAQVAEPAAQCPAEGFTHFDHCYIYEACYVLAPSLEWMADSVIDYGVAEVVKPVLQDVIRGGHHRQLAPSPHKTVLIAKAGASNYGHVLTDILPKLITIGRAGFTAVRLLLPEEMRLFAGLIGDVLAHLGVQVLEIEWIVLATLHEARDVYVMSPVARHNTRKSGTFLELRYVLATIYGVAFQRDRRLYIRRSPADKRQLTNAAAVEAAFVRRGYDSIYPPDLSLAGQIHLFASASHIAGSLGAGMANIGFAPPGCEVTMLDPGIGDFYFWDLACLAGLGFNWVFSGPLVGYTVEMSLGDYGGDLSALEQALDA